MKIDTKLAWRREGTNSCVCVYQVCVGQVCAGTHRGQERATDPLDLQFQTVLPKVIPGRTASTLKHCPPPQLLKG